MSAGIIKNKKNIYQWKINLWIAGYVFLCKVVFVCYFEQGASEYVTYMLVLQSFFVFCFFALLKVVGVLITIISYQKKSTKKVKWFVDKTIYIFMIFSLAGALMHRHTNDYSGDKMSTVSLALNLAFSAIYYQWIVDIPFYLIYKEEIDAELGL